MVSHSSLRGGVAAADGDKHYVCRPPHEAQDRVAAPAEQRCNII
jgi:hypothetical protein